MELLGEGGGQSRSGSHGKQFSGQLMGDMLMPQELHAALGLDMEGQDNIVLSCDLHNSYAA